MPMDTRPTLKMETSLEPATRINPDAGLENTPATGCWFSVPAITSSLPPCAYRKNRDHNRRVSPKAGANYYAYTYQGARVIQE